jgi:hypothetical protein
MSNFAYAYVARVSILRKIHQHFETILEFTDSRRRKILFLPDNKNVPVSDDSKNCSNIAFKQLTSTVSNQHQFVFFIRICLPIP